MTRIPPHRGLPNSLETRTYRDIRMIYRGFPPDVVMEAAKAQAKHMDKTRFENPFALETSFDRLDAMLDLLHASRKYGLQSIPGVRHE